jgi:hypothetical protein
LGSAPQAKPSFKNCVELLISRASSAIITFLRYHGSTVFIHAFKSVFQCPHWETIRFFGGYLYSGVAVCVLGTRVCSWEYSMRSRPAAASGRIGVFPVARQLCHKSEIFEVSFHGLVRYTYLHFVHLWYWEELCLCRRNLCVHQGLGNR